MDTKLDELLAAARGLTSSPESHERLQHALADLETSAPAGDGRTWQEERGDVLLFLRRTIAALDEEDDTEAVISETLTLVHRAINRGEHVGPS